MLEKFKIINKNQVIVFAIAIMLISVGYLNFTTMNKEASSNAIEYAGIGDAKLVSSSNIEERNEAIVENEEILEEHEIGEALSTSTENDKSNTLQEASVNVENEQVTEKENLNNEIVATSSKEVDEFFTSAKLNRQTMYSQMLETYQKILENDQISADQKVIAQTEIKNINDIKNKIMICENLIKIKAIEDVIIFVNDKSVSVVVKAKELKQEQTAQIQNIISREMGVEIDNIHISNKY